MNVDRPFQEAKLIAVGDIFLGGDLYYQGLDCEILSSRLQELFESVGVRIANLESPLIPLSKIDSRYSPMPDKLLHAAPEQMIQYLKKLHIDVVTLANNHIFDYGEEGLRETLRVLTENGIQYCGAGFNLQEARKPVLVDIGSVSFSLHSYTAYNMSYLRMIVPASEDSYGVAPLKLSYVEQDLDHSDADIKIVYLHWGREHILYPNPRDKVDLGKRIVDLGADVILGSHAHVIQRVDSHEGKPVFYSLGNFLFPNFCYQNPAQIVYPGRSELKDFRRNRTEDLPKAKVCIYKTWREINRISLVAHIRFCEDDITFEETYCIQDANEPRIDILDGESSNHIRDEVYRAVNYHIRLKKWEITTFIKAIRYLYYSYGFLGMVRTIFSRMLLAIFTFFNRAKKSAS